MRKLLILPILFLCLIGFQGVSAIDITWTGATSSDWNDETNWNPQISPTISDCVYMNYSSGHQPIATTNISFINVTFNSVGNLKSNLTLDAVTAGEPIFVFLNDSIAGNITAGRLVAGFFDATSYSGNIIGIGNATNRVTIQNAGYPVMPADHTKIWTASTAMNLNYTDLNFLCRYYTVAQHNISNSFVNGEIANSCHGGGAITLGGTAQGNRYTNVVINSSYYPIYMTGTATFTNITYGTLANLACHASIYSVMEFVNSTNTEIGHCGNSREIFTNYNGILNNYRVSASGVDQSFNYSYLTNKPSSADNITIDAGTFIQDVDLQLNNVNLSTGLSAYNITAGNVLTFNSGSNTGFISGNGLLSVVGNSTDPIIIQSSQKYTAEANKWRATALNWTIKDAIFYDFYSWSANSNGWFDVDGLQLWDGMTSSICAYVSAGTHIKKYDNIWVNCTYDGNFGYRPEREQIVNYTAVGCGGYCFMINYHTALEFVNSTFDVSKVTTGGAEYNQELWMISKNHNRQEGNYQIKTGTYSGNVLNKSQLSNANDFAINDNVTIVSGSRINIDEYALTNNLTINGNLNVLSNNFLNASGYASLDVGNITLENNATWYGGSLYLNGVAPTTRAVMLMQNGSWMYVNDLKLALAYADLNATNETITIYNQFYNNGNYNHNQGKLKFLHNVVGISHYMNAQQNDATYYDVDVDFISGYYTIIWSNATIEHLLNVTTALVYMNNDLYMGTLTNAGTIYNAGNIVSTTNTGIHAKNSSIPFMVTGSDFNWDGNGNWLWRLDNMNYTPDATTGGSGANIELGGTNYFDTFALSAGDTMTASNSNLELRNLTIYGNFTAPSSAKTFDIIGKTLAFTNFGNFNHNNGNLDVSGLASFRIMGDNVTFNNFSVNLYGGLGQDTTNYANITIENNFVLDIAGGGGDEIILGANTLVVKGNTQLWGAITTTSGTNITLNTLAIAGGGGTGTLGTANTDYYLGIGTTNLYVNGVLQAPNATGTLYSFNNFYDTSQTGYKHNYGTFTQKFGTATYSYYASGAGTTFYNFEVDRGTAFGGFSDDTNITILNILNITSGRALVGLYGANTATYTFGNLTLSGYIHLNNSGGANTQIVPSDTGGANPASIIFQAANPAYPIIFTGKDWDWDGSGWAVLSGNLTIRNMNYTPEATTGGGGVTIIFDGNMVTKQLTLSAGDTLDITSRSNYTNNGHYNDIYGTFGMPNTDYNLYLYCNFTRLNTGGVLNAPNATGVWNYTGSANLGLVGNGGTLIHNNGTLVINKPTSYNDIYGTTMTFYNILQPANTGTIRFYNSMTIENNLTAYAGIQPSGTNITMGTPTSSGNINIFGSGNINFYLTNSVKGNSSAYPAVCNGNDWNWDAGAKNNLTIGNLDLKFNAVTGGNGVNLTLIGNITTKGFSITAGDSVSANEANFTHTGILSLSGNFTAPNSQNIWSPAGNVVFGASFNHNNGIINVTAGGIHFMVNTVAASGVTTTFNNIYSSPSGGASTAFCYQDAAFASNCTVEGNITVLAGFFRLGDVRAGATTNLKLNGVSSSAGSVVQLAPFAGGTGKLNIEGISNTQFSTWTGAGTYDFDPSASRNVVRMKWIDIQNDITTGGGGVNVIFEGNMTTDAFVVSLGDSLNVTIPSTITGVIGKAMYIYGNVTFIGTETNPVNIQDYESFYTQGNTYLQYVNFKNGGGTYGYSLGVAGNTLLKLDHITNLESGRTYSGIYVSTAGKPIFTNSTFSGTGISTTWLNNHIALADGSNAVFDNCSFSSVGISMPTGANKNWIISKNHNTITNNWLVYGLLNSSQPPANYNSTSWTSTNNFTLLNANKYSAVAGADFNTTLVIDSTATINNLNITAPDTKLNITFGTLTTAGTTFLNGLLYINNGTARNFYINGTLFNITNASAIQLSEVGFGCPQECTEYDLGNSVRLLSMGANSAVGQLQIYYDAKSATGPESSIKMFRHSGGSWTELSNSGTDEINHIAYANDLTSFSWFMPRKTVGSSGTGSGTGSSIISLIGGAVTNVTNITPITNETFEDLLKENKTIKAEFSWPKFRVYHDLDNKEKNYAYLVKTKTWTAQCISDNPDVFCYNTGNETYWIVKYEPDGFGRYITATLALFDAAGNGRNVNAKILIWNFVYSIPLPEKWMASVPKFLGKTIPKIFFLVENGTLVAVRWYDFVIAILIAIAGWRIYKWRKNKKERESQKQSQSQ